MKDASSFIHLSQIRPPWKLARLGRVIMENRTTQKHEDDSAGWVAYLFTWQLKLIAYSWEDIDELPPSCVLIC